MSERIENMKNFYLSHNIAIRNKSKMQNYINSYIGINKNQTSDFSLINDSENEKNNTNIKSKFSQLESPYFENKFRSDIKAKYNSTNISTKKIVNSQNSKENFNSINSNTNFSVANLNSDKNQLYSFKSWYRKSNPNDIQNNINSFRVSYNRNDNINENQSSPGIIQEFNNSEKLTNKMSNPTLKYSLIKQIKNINNFNININILPSENKNEEMKVASQKNDSSRKEENSNVRRNEELTDKNIKSQIESYIKGFNLRESSLVKYNDYSSQNIIITKEKLEVLSKQTTIPLIQESDYTFINVIGEGTYGEVFLVEKNSTSEHYAMKKIICRDYNELLKHKNEIELLYSVTHENILNILGIQLKYLDETTGLIYVLMELAYSDWNKEIKRRILAKKYYKENDLIDIMKQIIKGFLFLQKRNIAHRDVKPQNILLFPNNIYKIADFGEAKNIKNKFEQSTLKGSELYMSPLLYEGYKYNQKQVLHDPYKSDVFSLGLCFLYAICLNLNILDNVREINTLRNIINTVNKFNIDNRYTEQFMNTIYGMVEPNERIRFDFESLFLELNKI